MPRSRVREKQQRRADYPYPYGGSESPRVAVNESGDVAFTWTDWEDTHDRIQGRVDLASAPLGGVRYLSDAGQSATNAQVAIDGAGNAMFAWKRWDGAFHRVQVRRLPASGAASTVNTRSAAGAEAGAPAVDVRSGGRVLSAWERLDVNVRIEYSADSPTAPPTAVGPAIRSQRASDKMRLVW